MNLLLVVAPLGGLSLVIRSYEPRVACDLSHGTVVTQGSCGVVLEHLPASMNIIPFDTQNDHSPYPYTAILPREYTLGKSCIGSLLTLMGRTDAPRTRIVPCACWYATERTHGRFLV